jgi:hypothetical protein
VGRGVYGFSSLVKQNKKGKNCAVFCFAGKRIFFSNICDVITSPEKEKSSANCYYSGIEFGRSRISEGSLGKRKREMV